MRMWLALAATALGFGVAAPAQWRPSLPRPSFTADDNGRTVRLPVGAELIVRLPEQAGTGQRWTLKDEYRFREIGAARVENLARPGIVGGPQARVFRLQITAGGRIPLDFRLRAVDRTTLQRVLIRVDAFSDGPPLPAPDDRRAQIVGEREANGLVSTRLGAPIEVRLPVRFSSGHSWQVLSSRNIAFEGVPGVRQRRGRYDYPGGDEGVAVFRLHTTVDRSDGFLTLGLMPPGERPDMHRAVRTLDYQFTNRR